MTQNSTSIEAQRAAYLKRLDRWQSWCVFPVVFAGFLFMSKPTSVRAVVIYRLALVLGGILGYVSLAYMKRRA